ncbi:hypothetical protein LTR85_001242 [Meristemomyces frigidus]|nr:hypothetical protein LTR85_001242 [Meristemomyces frigidus]
MAVAALLLLVSFATALRPAPYLPNDINEDFTLSRLQTQYDPGPLTELKVTDNVINLKRADSWSMSSVYVQALRRRPGVSRATNGSVNLVGVEAGQVFLAPVTVGGQSFDVVVDSGSSDPWLVATNFNCFEYATLDPETEDYCYFGTPYNASASSTYRVMANENFNISYADGESLAGSMGYESFTMGGITVPSQQFGVVNYAAWFGDGYSSGLVGFAYRTLTSAYAGTNPAQDQPGGQLLYNPLFVDMYTNQGVPPVFSLAIDRDPNNGGVLALGGIPNIPHSPVFASTPIIPVGTNSSSGQLVYEFYTIVVDGFAYSASESTQFNPYSNNNPRKTSLVGNGSSAIVDSGTTLFYAPNDVAEGVGLLFSPPGTYDETDEVWLVDCDAKPPVFGVGVGGKIFYVNPLDLVLQYSETQCISGIQPQFDSQFSVMGDVWMKNVIAVFDIGAEQMRFAARQYYGLTAQSKAANT